MSEAKTTYLVSDLAAELGVPRTTVNDWLKTYAAYLDFEARGKRKAYLASALAVLREISELRNAGKSALEIEAELALRHGIRPEVTSPAAPAAPEEPAARPDGTENTLPARQENAAPVRTFSDEELKKLFATLEVQEQDRRQAVRRFWRWVLLIVLLLLLALGLPLVLLTGRILDRMTAENRAAERRFEALHEVNVNLGESLRATRGSLESLQQQREADRQRAAKESAARQAELNKIAVTLDRSRQDYQDNVKRLTAELAAQREQAAAELNRLRQQSAKSETDLAAARAEFAARQKTLLEELTREAARRAELEKAAKQQAAAVRQLQAEAEKKQNDDSQNANGKESKQ